MKDALDAQDATFGGAQERAWASRALGGWLERAGTRRWGAVGSEEVREGKGLER